MLTFGEFLTHMSQADCGLDICYWNGCPPTDDQQLSQQTERAFLQWKAKIWLLVERAENGVMNWREQGVNSHRDERTLGVSPMGAGSCLLS